MSGPWQRGTLRLDPRDLSGDDHDLIESRRGTIRQIACYVPGVTGPDGRSHRQLILDIGAQQMVAHVAQGLHGPYSIGDLCGVFHDADVEIHELPHTIRALVARSVLAAEQVAGRPVAVFEVWTHIGPCPEQQGVP